MFVQIFYCCGSLLMYPHKPYLSQLQLNDIIYNFYTIEFDGILFDKLLKTCSVIDFSGQKSRIMFDIPTFYITTANKSTDTNYSGSDKKFKYVIVDTKEKTPNIPKYFEQITNVLQNILITLNTNNTPLDIDLTNVFTRKFRQMPNKTEFNNPLTLKCPLYYGIFKQPDLPDIFVYLSPDVYKMIHHKYSVYDKSSCVLCDDWTQIHQLLNNKTKDLQNILFDEYKLTTQDDKAFKKAIELEFRQSWERHLANIRIHYGCFLFTYDGAQLKPLSLLDNWIANGKVQILANTLERVSLFIEDKLTNLLTRNGFEPKTNNFMKYVSYPQSYVINVEYLNPCTNTTTLFPHVFANTIQLDQIINHMQNNIYDKIRFPLKINVNKLVAPIEPTAQTLQTGGGLMQDILRNCKLISYIIDTQKTICAIVKHNGKFYYLQVRLNPQRDELINNLINHNIHLVHNGDTIIINQGYQFEKYMEYDLKQFYTSTINKRNHFMYEIETFTELQNADSFVKHLMGTFPVTQVKLSSSNLKWFYDNIYEANVFPALVNGMHFDIINPYYVQNNPDKYANEYRNAINTNKTTKSFVNIGPIDKTKYGNYIAEEYPVQYSIENKLYYKQLLIVNTAKSIQNTIAQSEQINDIVHFLYNKNKIVDGHMKLSDIFVKIYSNLTSPNPNNPKKFAFDLENIDSNVFDYLNTHRLFFHAYTAFATGIIHLHNSNGIVNYKHPFSSESGNLEYRGIGLLFILLNLNILNPDFVQTVFSRFRSKIFTIAHLRTRTTIIGGRQFIEHHAHHKIIYLNDTSVVKLKVKQEIVSNDKINSIGTTLNKYHTQIRPQLRYFKSFLNHTIPEEIFMKKKIDDALKTNYKLNLITNHLSNRTQLCNMYNLQCTCTFIKNGDFNISDDNYNALILNPIKNDVGTHKYSFLYQVFLYRLMKFLSHKNMKIVIIRLIPTIVIPYVFCALLYISYFAKSTKIIRNRTMLYIIYRNISSFKYDVDIDVEDLKSTLANMSNDDIQNEIAQSQYYSGSIGNTFVYKINAIHIPHYNFKIQLFDCDNMKIIQDETYFKLLHAISKSQYNYIHARIFVTEIDYINELLKDVYFYEKHGIPVSKVMKKLISKNYKHMIYDFYANRAYIREKIIKNGEYDIKIAISDVDYSHYNSIYYKLNYMKIEKYREKSIYGNKQIDYLKKLLKQNRGTLKKHIMNMYKQNFKNIDTINDAYLKLYEILHAERLLKKGKNVYNTFHFAEAPGGFVLATNTYIKLINKSNDVNHNWFANSYNPTGQTLESLSDVTIGFGDDYGLIKRHPNKWLFGADNTGDITASANILNIKEKLKNIQFNLITGDGGIGANANISKAEHTYNMQKLDFAQMVLLANIATIDSNCVVKTFTNYITGYKLMEQSFGFYMSIIAMYVLMYKKVYLVKPVMSSDDSGEYYVVGKKFKGIDDATKNTLLKMLDNFAINTTFINLHEDLVEQIISFWIKITNLNHDNATKLNILAQCNDTKFRNVLSSYFDATGCTKYLDSKSYKAQVVKLNNNWISENKFKLDGISIDL